MKTSESIKEITGALVEFQKEVKGISKDGEGYNYKYITIDQILNLVRPALAKQGISLIQEVLSTVTDSGKIIDGVVTRLNHISGEFIQTNVLYLEATATPKRDGSVPPVSPQDHGSAITYAKRYQLSALLGLNADVDDDANQYRQDKNNKNAQNWGQKLSDVQYNLLAQLMKKKDVDKNGMPAIMTKAIGKIKGAKELTSDEADSIIKALEALPDAVS